MTYDHTIAVGAPPREARPSELSTINMTIDQLMAMLDRRMEAARQNETQRVTKIYRI